MRYLPKEMIEQQKRLKTRRLMQLRLSAAKRAFLRRDGRPPRGFRSTVQEALYFGTPFTADDWNKLILAGRCTMGALQTELDKEANASKGRVK